METNNNQQLERATINLPTLSVEGWKPKEICRLFEKSNEVISYHDVNYYLQRKIDKLFLDLPSEEQLFQIGTILKVYFGCNLDNTTLMLQNAIRSKISMQYAKLTVNDFITAYNRKEIVKRQGVAMTLNEFFEPIQDWFNVCNKISGKINREIAFQQEEERIRKESLEEYQLEQKKMLELFEKLKSEGKTEWTESDINALKISKIVSKGIVSVDEKTEIYNKVVSDEMEKRKIENPLSKLDSYFEMLGNQQLATYEIRFKCAKIVVERALLHYAKQ